MIVSTITDGFGNQLFMYACGYAMARRHKEKLALDTTYLATSNLREYELGGRPQDARYTQILFHDGPCSLQLEIAGFL